MKKSAFILGLLAVTISNYLSAQADLEKHLFLLPDVVFKKIETPEGYSSAYELSIKQPLDHKNPEAGYFFQRVYLSHKDFNAPTIMITNGYGRAYNNITEIASLTGANQINIEHRYFLESSPDSLDYKYLNFEQVCDDLHRINMIFRKIYQGKWMASGISKGGTTCIFYRYFYPDDVDVSIPYVAPVNHDVEDQRIYTFLDTVGTDECRNKIQAYQMKMLERAEYFKSYLKWFVKGQDLSFNYLSFDEAYEYTVLEYSFSFWQYGHDCNSIPGENASDDELMQHLIDIVGFQFYSDADMSSYASHYYQSGTQMGYYGYETDTFNGLINYLDDSSNPSAVFMPDKMQIEFDGSLTNKVYEWTKTADYMIYINGDLDTWSATAVRPSGKNNSLFFFMPGKHHASARIANMDSESREKLLSTIETWLDINIR